jgi:hypothetical protein
MKRLLIFLAFALPLAAQEKYYPYLDARAQCQQADGSWSNFKHRCDLTHKHFFKDPKTWIALAILGGDVLVVSLSANHVKQGGTFLFGTAGNATTSGDIALAGTATFAAMLGFQRFEWYLGHDDPDCPKGPWCNLSYFLLPGLVTGATAAEMAQTNWGHNPGPKPVSLPYLKRDWLYDMRKHQ